jgi:hypothetical protein
MIIASMHTAEEMGIDDFQARLSPDLRTVVAHYDRHLNLGLSKPEMADMIEYLKSL